MSSNFTEQTLGGYEIVSLIGRGGMGVVYKAYERQLNRFVALKTLPTNIANDPTFVDRFQREAQLAAGLDHPNIVPIYNVGSERGIYYIAMRLIEGSSLQTIIGQRGMVSPADTFAILTQVAKALDFAHRNRIIHRDIKPSNILIDRDGNAVLSDFGLAKAIAGSQVSALGLTGTPSYISPEQIENKPLGPATDIYALGLVAYEMLTGRLPFQGQSLAAVLHQQVYGIPPAPSRFNPQLTSEVDTVFRRVLAKSPDQRYTSASQFVAELSNAMGNTSVPTQTLVPTFAGIMGIIVLLTICIGLVVWMRNGPIQNAIIDIITSMANWGQSSLPWLLGIALVVIVLLTSSIYLRNRPLRFGSARPDHRKSIVTTPPTIDTALNTLQGISVIAPEEKTELGSLLAREEILTPLKEHIIHKGGGAYLLRGFGRFGSTALIEKIVQLAKAEISGLGGVEGNGVIMAARVELKDVSEPSAAISAILQSLYIEAIRGNYDPTITSRLKGLRKHQHDEVTSSSQGRSLSLKISPFFEITLKTDKTVTPKPEVISEDRLLDIISTLDSSLRDNPGLLESVVGRVLRNASFPSRIIFIIDRIDSENEFLMLRKIRLFDDKRISLFAVIRQDKYVSWPEDTRRMIEEMGFQSIYVHSIWEDQTPFIEPLIRSMIEGQSQPYAEKELHKELIDFKDHIAFETRGAPGEVVQKVSYYECRTLPGTKPTLRLDHLDWERARYNAQRERILRSNWSRLLGTSFLGREERDTARMGIYVLMDWIHSQGRFTWKQIKSASDIAHILIASSVAVREKTVRELLDVLTESEYLHQPRTDEYFVTQRITQKAKATKTKSK